MEVISTVKRLKTLGTARLFTHSLYSVLLFCLNPFMLYLCNRFEGNVLLTQRSAHHF